MKRYMAPKLVVHGDVVALTQGQVMGDTDPNGITKALASGSVGFNL